MNSLTLYKFLWQKLCYSNPPPLLMSAKSIFAQILLLVGLPYVVWVWLLAFILDPRVYRPIQISMFSYMGAIAAEFLPAVAVFMYNMKYNESSAVTFLIRAFGVGFWLVNLWKAPAIILMEQTLNPLLILGIGFAPYAVALIISMFL